MLNSEMSSWLLAGPMGPVSLSLVLELATVTVLVGDYVLYFPFLWVAPHLLTLDFLRSLSNAVLHTTPGCDGLGPCAFNRHCTPLEASGLTFFWLSCWGLLRKLMVVLRRFKPAEPGSLLLSWR